MNKHLVNEAMASILHSRATTDIQGIARNWGIQIINVEFDSVKTFFLTIPFTDSSNQSASFHPEFIKDLGNNGYDIKMIHSDKMKGQRMYGVVKKSL